MQVGTSVTKYMSKSIVLIMIEIELLLTGNSLLYLQRFYESPMVTIKIKYL
jgi:hypothetical protein